MTFFWLILLMAALGWYIGITLLVALRGAADIRGMLAELSARKKEPANEEPHAPPKIG